MSAKKIIYSIFVFFTFLYIVFFIPVMSFGEDNSSGIIKNGDFEQADSNNLPSDWNLKIYKEDGSSITLDNTTTYSGKSSLHIQNAWSNISQASQNITIEPNQYYKAAVYVKTKNVGYYGKGACIAFEGTDLISEDIKDTSKKWQKIEVYFTSNSNSANIILQLGQQRTINYSLDNNGEAWFDHLTVEKVDRVPLNATFINLDNNFYTAKVDFLKKVLNISFYIVLFIVLLIVFLKVISKKINILSDFNIYRFNTGSKAIYIILVLGLALRLWAALQYEGYFFDIHCFKNWKDALYDHFFNVYKQDIFLDYPPVYLYFLAVIGFITNTFHLNGFYNLIIILLKFVPILSDIATSYILYRIAIKKNCSFLMSNFIAAVYIFTSSVILDSAVWGQIDSLLTLFVLLGIYYLIEDKYKPASVFYVLAILCKPQAILFVPIFLFKLISKRSLKALAHSAVYGIATFIIVVLPFSLTQGPLWVFQLILKTLGQYKYASMNAFNLFYLLGGNFKEDLAIPFIFSFDTWGVIFVILTVIVVEILMLKRKQPGIEALSGAITIAFIFVLGNRMHERYLFPVLALLLLALIYYRKSVILVLYLLFNITTYVNIRFILFGYEGNYVQAINSIIILNIIGILLLFFSTILITNNDGTQENDIKTLKRENRLK